MATQIKLKGFVNLNINTDEYSFLKPINEENNKSTQNVNSAGRAPSSKVVAEGNVPIDLENLFIKLNFPEDAFYNIHLKGSRLYGTVNVIQDMNAVSDWDLISIVDTETPYQFVEFVYNGINYDVHIFNKQEFLKKLDEHDMDSLEFLFHPKSAIILDKENYSVNIDKNKLINSALSESNKQWYIAKAILNDKSQDAYLGLKRIWHSIRYLIFTEQILKYGKIYNFSAANSIYADIINSKSTNFSYFETNFQSIKTQYENIVKSYL